MPLKKELKKFFLFLFSFLGLFLLSKIFIIEPAISTIPVDNGNTEMKIRYGQEGLIMDSSDVSLFWGSVANENFQDIFYRLQFLTNKKSSLNEVEINLHPGLFAHKKFDGAQLDRIIPYYPFFVTLDRVFDTGVTYELFINFSKYYMGVPFRSSREIGLILNNYFQSKNQLPYFSKKVYHFRSGKDNYLANTHYFWLITEMLVDNEVILKYKIDREKIVEFPEQIKIRELLDKVKKIYKDKIDIDYR